jgi:hypothetical protein
MTAMSCHELLQCLRCDEPVRALSCGSLIRYKKDPSNRQKAMDTLLILLGVLGFAAIIISLHVFSADADREVYGDDSSESHVRGRAQGDRRSGFESVFPLLINGIMVNKDRRLRHDRRQSISA